MGNSRYGLSFVVTYRRKKSACRHKKNPFPDSLPDFWQDRRAQRNRRTSTAASSCMGILGFSAVNFNATVHMAFLQAAPLFLHQIQQDLRSYLSQVSGDDPVIPCLIRSKILQILFDCMKCRRSHGSSHIHRISGSNIDRFSGSKCRDLCQSRLPLFPNDDCPAPCHRPGRGHRALVPVGKRKTELFFCGGKMAGRHG